jgi:uncharacterized protein (DUF1800 family)
MTMERREFLKLAGLVAAGATLSACSPAYRLIGEALEPPAPWVQGDNLTFRLLQRMTYGATLAERQRAAEIGIGPWIEEQLDPASLPDPRADLALRPLTSLALEAADLAAWERADVLSELKRGAMLRQVYSRRQLQELLVEFWTDHFNISVEKGACWYLKTIDDREVVRRHALGNFRDLLWASAHSPAMIVYLDNQANDRRAPNENYARELLELHTLGIDGGYSQSDVMEMARCLTGWTVKERFWRGQFTFKPEMHDNGAKRVLGAVIGPGGQAEAEEVLDVLAVHPATARRLAQKLTRRFLEPGGVATAELEARACAAFLQSGGEIEPMLRVILLDGVVSQGMALAAKLKRPVNFVASALRLLRAATDAGQPVQEHLARMGQAPFGWPTPDGPPDEAASWQSGLLARWEFAYDLARNEMEGSQIDAGELLKTAGVVGATAGFDALASLLLGVPLAEPARSSVLRAMSKVPEEEAVPLLLAGLMASPAFQWR